MTLTDEDILRLARTPGKFSELVGQRIGFGRKQEGPLEPQPDDEEILLYVKRNAWLMSEARKALVDEGEEVNMPQFPFNLDETLDMVKKLYPDESGFSKRYVLSNIKQAKNIIDACLEHLANYSDSHEDWQLGRIGKWKLEFEKILKGEVHQSKEGAKDT